MTNLSKRIDTDDIANLAITLEKLSQSVQDALGAEAVMTTKGDLIGFSTLPARLAVGTNDKVLTADSTAPLGIAWKTAAGSSSPLTTKGDLYTRTSVDARLPVGTDGQVLMAVPGTGLSTSDIMWTDLLTVKGDILTRTSTPGSAGYAALGVGANGYVLTADAVQSKGIKWAPPPVSHEAIKFASTRLFGGETLTLTLDSFHLALTNQDLSSSNMTFTFPPSATDGNTIRIFFADLIGGNGLATTAGTITWNPGAGQTFGLTPPTSIASGKTLAWIFDAFNGNWWPTQV